MNDDGSVAAPEQGSWADEQPASDVVLEQRFSKLEDALNLGVWEADGDDLSLYVCEEGADDGPAGAMFVAQGEWDAEAQLVHFLRDGKGARISELSMTLICEELDIDTCGTFTVGLAYDDDFEEATLLAITLRHPRVNPGDGDATLEELSRVQLKVNGELINAHVGSLPLVLQLDARLCWDSAKRSVKVRHRIAPARLGGAAAADVGINDVPYVESAAGFYTTGVKFEHARAVCLRGTGTVRVRLIRVSCSAVASGNGGSA
mmetsp:Transcript_30526/g.59898  ORF Transcript_30526/g.59898 Transcript_30526/m.59898 type:complete len:261 (+) Transcript_30526:44-826(+)|eukprot:CAMPEP_0172672628 /NCGR_PEP_ID=MMETSP1074-20121228/11663_1 /TAXON_ID=2916 /ORGANISM="Ceratium fusus, Strain PA161109" /LENGTH=260 /DNA_ID=CAMNT_0013489841 /DNA_START=40 /DNA_END=822 /DNA_ORIENTATION=+